MSSSRKAMRLKKGKRKSFRFPIYDDIESLKLKVQKSHRIIFEGDDFITNHIHDRPNLPKEKSATVDSYDTDHVYKNKVSSDTRTPQITINSSNNEAMKINRPTSKRFTKAQYVSSKDMNKQPLYHAKKYTAFQNKNWGKDIVAKKKEARRDYISELQYKNSRTTKEQSFRDNDRFFSRMKKTPASLSIKHEKSIFTKDELLSSMRKDLGSFILFDDEKLPLNLKSEQKMQSELGTKSAVNRKKNEPILKDKSQTETFSTMQGKKSIISIKEKAKDRQSRVLDRGLAGIFEEESKGIDKVKNKFFSD
ncbi:MAG: hypothetical protein LBS28_01255 [Streptococcaceae bacterium]|nr:hypothetical protein [Streptococcaceae bacterium]